MIPGSILPLPRRFLPCGRVRRPARETMVLAAMCLAMIAVALLSFVAPFLLRSKGAWLWLISDPSYAHVKL